MRLICMQTTRALAFAVLLLYFFEARASSVIDFCTRWMQKAEQNQMRCIAEPRSAFAKSVLIINTDEKLGPQIKAQAIFSGKAANNREMSGTLKSERAPDNATKITFLAKDDLYTLEIYAVVTGKEVIQPYWRVTNSQNGMPIEMASLKCYGPLWHSL
jgi:hypothetical protein